MTSRQTAAALIVSWLVIVGVLSVLAAVAPRAAAQTITVTSPTASTVWNRGDYHEITWTSSGAGSFVKIEYDWAFYSTPVTITSSTLNDGSYSWYISSSMTPRTNYLIRITDTSDPLTYDDSPLFEISQFAGTIEVTKPDFLTVWDTGSTYDIEWTSTGSVGTDVEIEYQYLLTYTWSTIVSSTPNDGSYSWTVPSSLSPGPYYRVRVTDASDNSISGESDLFQIRQGSNPMLLIAVIAIIIIIIVVVIVVVALAMRKRGAAMPPQANIPVGPPPTGYPQQYAPPQYAPTQQQPMPQQQAPRAPSGAMKLCVNCGKSLPADFNFCMHCGGRT